MKKSDKTGKNETSGWTHPVSFRVSESHHQDFLALLRSVPGADAGAMYREIFSRGLRDLETYYEKHHMPTLVEIADEVQS